MEAQWDAGRQVNARHRLRGEVLGRKEDQVGRASVGIVHERHYIAVVLGGVWCGRGEHGLARGGVAAEFVRLHGALDQVVLEDGVGESGVRKVPGGCDGAEDLTDDGAIPVAVWPGDDTVVYRGNSCPRSSRRCWVTVPAPGSMVHRSRVTGPRAADIVETSKPSLYWQWSARTRPRESS